MREVVKFHFKYRKKKKAALPVNPEKLIISRAGKNSEEALISGDVNILKSPGLFKIKFDSFFPSNPQDGAGYLVEGASPYNSEFWIDFFNSIREEGEPVRLTITGLGIPLSWEVGVEVFEYFWEGSDSDVQYSLELKEFLPIKAKIIPAKKPRKAKGNSKGHSKKKQSKTSKSGKPRSNPKKFVTVGCDVLLNGRVYRDSFGGGPGKTFSNFRGKVNLIKKKNPLPYHVTTPSGGWLGWVKSSSVEVI